MGLQGFVLEPIPAVSGRGQGTPWTSHQLIAGPSLMAKAAMQSANHTSGAYWYFSNFCILLKDQALVQLSSAWNWYLNQRPSDH